MATDKKFTTARGNLAHSQSLLDNLMKSKMAQQSPQMEQPPQPQPQPQPAPQPEPTPTQTPQHTPEEPSKEMGAIATFMNEVRGLFKGKEDEEKKTQQLVEQHNKEMDQIKQGLTDLLDEEHKQN